MERGGNNKLLPFEGTKKNQLVYTRFIEIKRRLHFATTM